MLKQRVATAIVLVSALLLVVFRFDTAWFGLVLALVVLIAAVEWAALAGIRGYLKILCFLLVIAMGLLLLWTYRQSLTPLVILGGAFWWVLILFRLRLLPEAGESASFRVLSGVLVLLPAWSALVYLHQANLILLLSLFAIVWLADIGAYFAGRQWGRRKLAPAISPGKTIEGVVGGILLVAVCAVLTAAWANFSPLCASLWLVVSVVTLLFSVLGDLWESKMKRIAGVKDSGFLLPGHGGILDRIDSVTAAAPVFVALIYLLTSPDGLCARFF